MTGAVSYHAGIAAEDIVARCYEAKGFVENSRRWKCKHGEIDLVLSRGAQTVFVEVKKSRSFASAERRITATQLQRVQNAASQYMADLPNGLDSEVRFDVALVDAQGSVKVIENVTVH